MDFNLTDEQKDIIKAAREFAEKEFPGLARSAIERKTRRTPFGKGLVNWVS